MTGLAMLTAAVASAVGYLEVTVPLAGPSFAHAKAFDYWQVAAIAGLVVLVAAIAVAWLSFWAMKRKQ
jgi:hypothetical protein